MEFDTVKDGQFITRVLRKTGAQDVTGAVTVLGDVALNTGTVTSSFLGSLGVANAAASYSYDSQQSKHVVKNDYTISSGLTSTTVSASTIGERDFATFVTDTIDKTAVDKQTIS